MQTLERVYGMTESDYNEAPALSAQMDIDAWYDHVTSDRLNSILRDVDRWARKMTDNLATLECVNVHSLPVAWKE